ncbi:SNF1-related protein kinase regulatory subunit gamma-1-like [Cucumis melo var. makuwa]|uniref:SNF1-related protein kinase regulatory subunit gamma-1-like n=1 Tax=Cucumis melo var. makuwa TaxID=1194695 RepID=A0A5A7TW16_CUCMM|nr:SNF1-related protein kinase regulatory subunit gamma-1-like [Cucumis melo var. makuwa]
MAESNQTQCIAMDSATALQRYLDHIPVSSISGIKSSVGNPPFPLFPSPCAHSLFVFYVSSTIFFHSVLEVKTGDFVKDAIRIMFKKNVASALIADVSTDGFPDRFIGFVHLSSLLLWCIQVGELGKTFLWDPYFPVGMRDTLFHVLLMFSKHRLQAVPVVELSNSHVIGFITQRIVYQQLNNIVVSFLGYCRFRFDNEEHVLHVYGDQNIIEAFYILWNKQIGAVAVTDRGSKRLIGCLRNSDAYLLLEKEDLFQNRKRITVKEFIHMEPNKERGDANMTVEGRQGALTLSGERSLINSKLPNMHTPVTNKRDDTLKQVMKTMVETNSSFSFLVNNLQQAMGILTLRDMITQFAPPCMNSAIQGGSFFESALEQTGCQVRNGTIICNRTF